MCPECGDASHDTAHLFECRSFPTTLTKMSLWANTWAAAEYLKTTPSFNFFPDLGTPPQQRPQRGRLPPEPPPPLQLPQSPVFSPLSIPSPFLFSPPNTPARVIPPLMLLDLSRQAILSPVSSGTLLLPVSSGNLSELSTSQSPPSSPPQDPRYARSEAGSDVDLLESD